MRLMFAAAVAAFAAACSSAPPAQEQPIAVPVATAPPAEPAQLSTIVGEASYLCVDGSRFTATFSENPSQVRLSFVDNTSLELAQTPAASGFAYVGAGGEFRGKGKDAMLTRAGAAPTNCTDVTEAK